MSDTTTTNDKSDECPDFVLQLRDHAKNPGEKTNEPLCSDKKRDVFEANLRAQGLILRQEKNKVKITIPDEVMYRYCEILKIRLPINEECLKGKGKLRQQKAKRKNNHSEPYTTVKKKHKSKWTAEYSGNRNLQDLFLKDCFTPSLKGMIIQFILDRESFGENSSEMGIGPLIGVVYQAAYPLHEGTCSGGKRGWLIREWASFGAFFKHQPIDEIADYCGYKIGLYFSWLGYYTFLLTGPAILGIIATFRGLFTFENDSIVKEVCSPNSSHVMCPRCDTCDFWDIKEACLHTKISRVIDNVFTVFFSLLMCVWSAAFLKIWKRHNADIIHRWGLTGYDILSETPRPEYLNSCQEATKEIYPVTGNMEPVVPFWKEKFPRLCLSYTITLFWVLITLAVVFSIVLYEIILEFVIFIEENSLSTQYDVVADILISVTSGIISLIAINILNWCYGKLAKYLTDREYHRTQTEYENNLIVKIFLFQFVNYYSSLFYIAFFKGKFTGYPGQYRRIFGFRQEECRPGGCLFELAMQLGIIMVGDQIKDNLVEFFDPAWQRMKKEWKNSDAPMFLARIRNVYDIIREWDDDEKLEEYKDDELISDYLEMVMQYGFVTLFVTAFPLAPVFALLNNLLEIRLDSKKIMFYYRRPVCQRVENIGVWYNIINIISKISVVSNAVTIAFTSNFIPLHMSYRKNTSFLNYTLSVFRVSDFKDEMLRSPIWSTPNSSRLNFKILSPTSNVTECLYEGFRYPAGHSKEYLYTDEFWKMWFFKFSFVITFLVIVASVIILLEMIIPDVPKKLKLRMKAEAFQVREIIIDKGNEHRGRAREQGSKETLSLQ